MPPRATLHSPAQSYGFRYGRDPEDRIELPVVVRRWDAMRKVEAVPVAAKQAIRVVRAGPGTVGWNDIVLAGNESAVGA